MDGNQSRLEHRKSLRSWRASAVVFFFFFFFFNLRTECLNEPGTCLSEICLVLTFLFSRPHPGWWGGLWLCHIHVDAVCLGLLLEAGGGPDAKVQNRHFHDRFLGGAQYLYIIPDHGVPGVSKDSFGTTLWQLPGNRSQPMTQSLCSAYLLLGPLHLISLSLPS